MAAWGEHLTYSLPVVVSWSLVCEGLWYVKGRDRFHAWVLQQYCNCARGVKRCMLTASCRINSIIIRT